jgi:2-(1,2-epoxy-1,2-dihydrophenyl)acetyl-CoA isomerase
MNYQNGSSKWIRVELEPTGVLTLTLANPKDMNAVNLEMIAEIGELLPQLAADPRVHVVVLTGEGKAFCAGGNMRALTDETAGGNEGPLTRPLWNVRNLDAAERLRAKQTTGLRLMRLLYELEKPTIAAVNGPAAGAGMDLALCCDMRIMADDAYMIESYVKVGLIPFDGAMWLLPRLIGTARAYELMYTGRKVLAAECERLGLANKIVPAGEVVAEATRWATDLAQGPLVTYGIIKHVTQKSLQLNFAESLDLSYSARDVVFVTEDHKEGVQAFFERRKPNFKGR